MKSGNLPCPPRSMGPFRSPISFVAALLLLPLSLAAAEGLAWWWMKGGKQRPAKVLHYEFPDGRYGYRRIAVEEEVVRMLEFDNGTSGLIDAGAGRGIHLFYFEWNSTDITGRSEAFGHAPEACMGNLGMQVEEYLPSRECRIGGLDLVFDATRFRKPDGEPLTIFKLAWAEGMDGINPIRESGGEDAMKQREYVLRSVGSRWRPRFARVLMLGVHGVDSEEDAWSLVETNVLGDVGVRTLGGDSGARP